MRFPDRRDFDKLFNQLKVKVLKIVVDLFTKTKEPVKPKMVLNAFRARHPDLARLHSEETVTRVLRKLADEAYYHGYPPLTRVGRGEYVPNFKFHDSEQENNHTLEAYMKPPPSLEEYRSPIEWPEGRCRVRCALLICFVERGV